MLTGKYFFKYGKFGGHTLMVEDDRTSENNNEFVIRIFGFYFKKTKNGVFYRKAKQEDVKWLYDNNIIEKPSKNHSFWNGSKSRYHEITGNFTFKEKLFGGLKLIVELYSNANSTYWITATEAQLNHFMLKNGL